MRVLLRGDACSSRRESALTWRRMSGLTSAATNGFELRVLGRGVDHQRRIKLFQHVTILLEQQAEELLHVMTHNIHFESFNDARVLDRFIIELQSDHLFQWQHVSAAQIKIRVRRRKAVKVRAADGGE